MMHEPKTFLFLRVFSILLYILAAIAALRPEKGRKSTGYGIAGAVAIFLVGLLASLDLYVRISASPLQTGSLESEVLFLAASILLFTGVVSVRLYMKSTGDDFKKLDDYKKEFEDFIENANDMIQRVAPDGTLLLVNRAWLENLGYRDRSEVLGKNIFDLIHPDDRSDCQNVLKRILKGENVTSVETKFLRKDGSYVIVEGNVNCQMKDGVPVATRGIFRNVTRQRLVDRVVREVFRATSGITGVDFFAPLVERLAETLGVRYAMVGEIEGSRTGSVRILAFTPKEGVEAGDVYTLSGTPCEKVAAGSVCYYEKNVRNLFPADKMLQELGVESYLGVPLSDSCGNCLGLLTVLDDKPFHDPGLVRTVATFFASRAGAELQRLHLEKERALLATAVEQCAEGILITDGEGTVIYANPALEKLTGFPLEEVIGRNPRFLKSGKHFSSFYEEMWQTITSGKVWFGRVTNKRKDGCLYEEELTISPVRDYKGRIRNFVAIKRDVTQIQELENQLRHAQKMEAVGTLTGGIAHDFNNLLLAISGYTQFALEDLPDQKAVAEHLTEVLKASDRASDLVRRLLAFSRKETIEPVVLDLNDAIAELLKMLRRLIGEHIDLQFDPKADPATICADPGQIEQVLLNLCCNSRDAMAGGGTIVIETRNVTVGMDGCRKYMSWAEPGAYVELTLSDTGHGVAPEVMDRIFDPFFTTKEVGKGTGLGLSSVYGIVKQSHGAVRVENAPAGGAVFRILFPVAERPVPEKRDESGDGPLPASGNEATVLIAEDDDRVRDVAVRILESAGYHTLTASNGMEALELLENSSRTIDLLVLDLVMPKMNGLDVYRKVRNLRPRQKVLFFTGYACRDFAEDGGLGGLKVIRKPFQRKELLENVRAVLS